MEATAQVKETSAPKLQPRPILSPERMTETEDANRTFTVVVPYPTTYEEILAKDFWANVSQRLTQYDRITAIPDDGSWYAELLVANKGDGWANVKELRHIVLDERETAVRLDEAPEDYPVFHKGKFLKFCVTRRADGAILSKGFDRKSDAIDWAKNYARGQKK